MTLRNTGRATAAAELVELDRGECLRLLGKSTVGRVVFTEGALPAAHPVTYLLDDEDLLDDEEVNRHPALAACMMRGRLALARSARHRRSWAAQRGHVPGASG